MSKEFFTKEELRNLKEIYGFKQKDELVELVIRALWDIQEKSKQIKDLQDNNYALKDRIVGA